jgi:hypothetical protein
MSLVGWRHQSAALTVHGILTVDVPNPAMTAVITEQPFTKHSATGSYMRIADI